MSVAYHVAKAAGMLTSAWQEYYPEHQDCWALAWQNPPGWLRLASSLLILPDQSPYLRRVISLPDEKALPPQWRNGDEADFAAGTRHVWSGPELADMLDCSSSWIRAVAARLSLGRVIGQARIFFGPDVGRLIMEGFGRKAR